MALLEDINKKYKLKMDTEKSLDIDYGNEFYKKHKETTFKNPDTIFTDVRLRKLFELIMNEAIDAEATDILISPQEKYGIVKLRTGRIMYPYRALHKGAVESLVTYIRVLAETNPEAINKPVSTKHRFERVEKEDDSGNTKIVNYDTRLQFNPSNYGSSVSIRIFYPKNLNLSIDELGLADVVAYNYKQALRLREGLIILSGPTGSGKALDIETDIPMFNGGFKKLKHIKIGDYIIDNKGDKTKVLAIYNHKNKKSYEIVFSDGLSVISDLEHNWEVYERNEPESKVMTTKELIENGIDCKDEGGISTHIKRYFIRNILNPVNYQKKETIINPYILGIWLNKGDLISSKLTDINESMVCKIKDFGYDIVETNKSKHIAKNKDGITLINQLNKLNLLNNKHIPDNYLYSSIEDRKQLLEGIIDSNNDLDGQDITVITTFSKELSFQIKQLIESLGFKTKTIIENKSYPESIEYKIYFKYNKNIDSDDSKRYIDEIREVSKRDTKCLTVDSENHLFLCTKSYLPTHNTTTEYVGMNQILRDSDYTSNILTAEDPIEYNVEGINQTEIDEVHGYTFAEATKSFLRMNPDVLLIGEVRDDDTAKTVTRASTSGHLALTTIHANSTLEVLDVLKQYNVHPNDIKNAVKLIIFQVLEDKLCPHCRVQKILKPHQKQWLDRKLMNREELAVAYELNPEGCEKCDYKGTKGKIMLNEMLVSNFEFRTLKDLHGSNLDSLKHALVNSEENVYYPIEWDVHRRIKEGDIDFETATRLIH